MIINEKIKIKITEKNIKHFKIKGYDCNLKDILEIKTEDLNPGSHIKIQVRCDVCENEKELSFQKYIKNIKNSNFYACSSKCAQEKVKKTSIKNFGTEYYMQTDEYKKRVIETDNNKYGCHHTQSDVVKHKQINTLLDKYGVDNYFKSEEFKKTNSEFLESKGVSNVFQLDEVKEKSKSTCYKKYGVYYSAQYEKVKQKQKQTILEKYGCEFISQNKKIKEKILNTNIKKFGVKNVLLLPENKEKAKLNFQKNFIQDTIKKYKDIKIIDADINQKSFKIECIKGHEYIISYKLFYSRNLFNTELCTICNPIEKHISGLEFQLLDFITQNYNKEIITNTKKIISPLELDIYLPELKLAFEFNGLFWHNELNKENNYHLIKTEECEKQGIQLIHIYEDDWMYKKEIIKSMILNKIGKTPDKIYARKCIIKEIIDNKLIREFLDKNHIQGFIGSKIKIGLFYNNELVSLMSFGNRRVAMGKKKTNENEYELLRFCNKLNTNIVGGASKLFNYFIKNYNPHEITTYADRSFSQGNLYKQLGFEFSSKTESNYYYIIDYIRYHRFNFRKDILVKQGFDSNKTEHQIMLERNIYRIYDSGNLKFMYKRSKI